MQTPDTFGLWTLGDPIADTKAPGGPIENKWTKRKFDAALVNPANRRKLSVIIVGTGLAGGAAAATLAGQVGDTADALAAHRVGAALVAAVGTITVAFPTLGIGYVVARMVAQLPMMALNLNR